MPRRSAWVSIRGCRPTSDIPHPHPDCSLESADGRRIGAGASLPHLFSSPSVSIVALGLQPLVRASFLAPLPGKTR